MISPVSTVKNLPFIPKYGKILNGKSGGEMHLYSIASGSSGNSIYVGDGKEEGILIDAGISKKKILEGLNKESIPVEGVKAICLTHEHRDHVQGLGPFLRTYGRPVYATEGTIAAIFREEMCGKLDRDMFHVIREDHPVQIGSLEVMPFAISHDAAEPVCFTISDGKKKVAVATDMGRYSDYTCSHLEDCDGALVEANYDEKMLQVGPYPYMLKMRILSELGHLSNETSGNLIRRLIHKKCKKVMLGHLSLQNNFPELAFETVKQELERDMDVWNEGHVSLQVAHRKEPTEVLVV